MAGRSHATRGQDEAMPLTRWQDEAMPLAGRTKPCHSRVPFERPHGLRLCDGPPAVLRHVLRFATVARLVAALLPRICRISILTAARLRPAPLTSNWYLAKGTQPTTHGTPHTAHGTQHTAHGTQHTAHSTQHTTHGTHSSTHSLKQARSTTYF